LDPQLQKPDVMLTDVSLYNFTIKTQPTATSIKFSNQQRCNQSMASLQLQTLQHNITETLYANNI